MLAKFRKLQVSEKYRSTVWGEGGEKVSFYNILFYNNRFMSPESNDNDGANRHNGGEEYRPRRSRSRYFPYNMTILWPMTRYIIQLPTTELNSTIAE